MSVTPDDVATIDAAMRIIARYAGYGIAIHFRSDGRQVAFFASNFDGRQHEIAEGRIDDSHAPAPGEAFADLARRLAR
jgi:hypothetical protein